MGLYIGAGPNGFSPLENFWGGYLGKKWGFSVGGKLRYYCSLGAWSWVSFCYHSGMIPTLRKKVPLLRGGKTLNRLSVFMVFLFFLGSFMGGVSLGFDSGSIKGEGISFLSIHFIPKILGGLSGQLLINICPFFWSDLAIFPFPPRGDGKRGHLSPHFGDQRERPSGFIFPGGIFWVFHRLFAFTLPLGLIGFFRVIFNYSNFPQFLGMLIRKKGLGKGIFHYAFSQAGFQNRKFLPPKFQFILVLQQ